jgi:hypothetical protein
VIRDFIEMLDILSQNPDLGVEELLGSGDFVHAEAPAGDGSAVSERFAEFEI